MKKLLRTLPSAYLLFHFYLLAFNVTIQKILVIGIVGCYVIANYKRAFGISVRKSFEGNVALISLLVLLTATVPVLSGTFDFSLARKMLTMYTNLLFWVAFIIRVKKTSVAEKTSYAFALTDEFGRVMTLYVLFTVFCVTVPGLKDFWVLVVSFSEGEKNLLADIAGYAGRVGWDGFAGYTATFMCSLDVFFCCLYLFGSGDRHKKYQNYTVYFYLAVAFIGNFLYGRTGLITSLAILAAFVILNSLHTNQWKYLLAIFLGAAFLLVLVNTLKERIEVFANIYKWAFEPFLNYLSGRGFTTTSSDVLINSMYFMPSFSTVALGDGRYTNPGGAGYYMGTDAGFMRLILYWGIFPTILLYLCLIYSYHKSLLGNKMICFLILFGLFEFKGEICWYMIPIFAAAGLLGDNPHCKRKIVLGK